MQYKIDFFEVHPEDKNVDKIPNLSINSIISFRESNNQYNTDVFVRKFGWVCLKINFEKFKLLCNLHS